MRSLDEMRADLKIVEAAYIQPSPNLSFAIEDLATDFKDLLDELAEKEEEIEALTTVLSAGQMLLCQKDTEIELMKDALTTASELFGDECTLDERDSLVWLIQTQELLGR